MMTNDLLIELERADPAGRRQILRDLPVTHDPATLAVLARQLADAEPAVCEAAVEALAWCGSREAAEVAALRLRSGEPAERGYAVDVLVRLGSAAVPTIATLLGDPDRDVRKYAAEALASIGDETALTALVILLQDDDVTVAAAAAEALGLLRQPEAIPPLAAAARSGPEWLRVAALFGLGEIGGPLALAHICTTPVQDSPLVLSAAAEAAGRAAPADPARAAAFLASVLAREDGFVHELALPLLGRVLGPGTADRLAPALTATIEQAAAAGLHSGDAAVRTASVRCLGALPAPSTVDRPALLRRLMATDPAPAARLAALEAAGGTGALDDAELMIRVRRDGDRGVRLAALRLLAERPSGEISAELDDLLTALTREDADPASRALALRIRLVRGDAGGVALALQLLADEAMLDDEAALAALLACPAAARVAVARAALADAEAPRRQIFAALMPVERLAELAHAEGTSELLRAAAAHEDWQIRAHATRLLRGAAAGWSRALIHRACDDVDGRVRVRAAEALASLVDVGPEEVARLHARLADESAWVRAAALSGLAALGRVDERTIEAALADPFPPVRRAALLAALQLAREHGDGLDDGLRRQAVRAACAAALDDDPELARIGRELTRRLG